MPSCWSSPARSTARLPICTSSLPMLPISHTVRNSTSSRRHALSSGFPIRSRPFRVCGVRPRPLAQSSLSITTTRKMLGRPPRRVSSFVFYRAFLAWRQANGWDNEIADHLPELFRSAGLVGIQSHIQDEVIQRGERDFDRRASLWSEVIQNVGEQISKAGFCTSSEAREAQEAYDCWSGTALLKQTLCMRAVTGIVP
jgi:hypothetical protein